MLKSLNFDRLGTYASAICAVHCLLTGVALGLLSFAGIGFMGSLLADVAFLAIAVIVAIIAIFHGMRRHHSYRPAMVFALGLFMVVLGHFVFRHEHKATSRGFDIEDVASTFFSVGGGVCFVLFHVLNSRLQRACGCKHCSSGE